MVKEYKKPVERRKALRKWKKHGDHEKDSIESFCTGFNMGWKAGLKEGKK